MKYIVNDNRKSVQVNKINSLTPADFDRLFVGIVAPLSDVLTAAEKLDSLYEV